MTNCIERHPVKSLLITFIAAVGTAWVIVVFSVKDSVELNHNAQLQALEAQKQQCEQRIDVLEQEIKALKRINDIYWECISTNPELTTYMRTQIDKLMSDRKRLAENEIKQFFNIKDSLIIERQADNKNTNINSDKTTIEERILKNDSYINTSLGIVIGVCDILVNNRAEIKISTSDSKVFYDDVSVGTVYNVVLKGYKCQIAIKRINYIYGYVDVVINRI